MYKYKQINEILTQLRELSPEQLDFILKIIKLTIKMREKHFYVYICPDCPPTFSYVYSVSHKGGEKNEDKI